MSKLRVHCFTLSLDGYGAGPDQDLEHPLGRGGENLHGWFRPTNTFQTMIGRPGGTTGIDDQMAQRGLENLGAWILGRNMFSPQRGPWVDHAWKGWWGDNPPYHVPVFVLTHHARPSIEMAGGTTFHFVTGGPGEALQRARQAAGGRDIRVGGGVATVRAYLSSKDLDHVHLAVAPVLLGGGEHLFAGLDLPALGYRVTEQLPTEAATHVMIGR